MSFPPAKSTLLIVFAGLLLTSFLLPDDGPLSTGSCLPKEAADKILGQPAMLTESSQEDLANVVKHRCTYSAVKEDSRTHKTGHLYFVDELYRDPTSAHLAFANVLSTNQGMEGQELVNNIGDEAWLHTDKQNFYLMIVRKGKRVVKIKVNKLTSLASLDALEQVVKQIAPIGQH